MKKIYFFLAMLFAVNGVWGQTTYTWNQTGTTSWATSTNWTPTRTTPAVDDILVFDNAATTTATGVPTQTIGQLSVSNSTTVNLQGAAAATVLTVGGGTGTDLSVASGSALNINVATNTTTIALATGATGSISGNMSFTTAAHKLTAIDASAITFQSGSVFTAGTGFSSNAFGTTNLNSIVFASGSTYVQIAGANPFGATQPGSVVVFQAGSLFKMMANLAPSFSGRTYANLEINAAAFSQSPTGTNPLTIDNLIITDGTLNINLTSAGVGGVNIKGNITVAAGETLTFNPAVAAANNLTFNGTAAQSITNAGTLTFGANEPVVIANASGVTFNTAQIISGTMTVNAGALLATSAALTLTGSPAINGSFQLNQGGSETGGTMTYGSSSTLIYAGTSTQTASATEFPAASGPNSLTINNAAGVSFPAAFIRTINGTVNMISGSLTLNAGAALSYGAAGILKYSGSSAQTSADAEFPTVSGPFSLEINNGSGVTLHAARTLNGNLTLTNGILTLGANDLIVSGTLSGGSSTSYIKTNSTGSFTLNTIGAGPVLIPVGNSTYNSLSFTNGSGLNWTIRVEDAVNNVVLPFTTDKAINRTWHISPSAPVVTGPDVTFNFDDADVSQLTNPAAYSGDPIRTAQVWHYTGTQWLAATGYLSMTALAGPQSLALNGYTYYSPFAISKSSGPLPVKFTNVRAYQQGSAVKIDWSNLTESNVANYVVERSANGSSFTALNTIGASRHDGGRADYTSLDVSPLNGVNFYRIRSNELDSKLLYSAIVKVNTKEGVAGITIYPNPVTGGQVSLQTSGLGKGEYIVRVFNAAGQQVFSQLLNHNGGAATEVIQLPAALKAGMYNLQLSGGELKLAKPFIIK